MCRPVVRNHFHKHGQPIKKLTICVCYITVDKQEANLRFANKLGFYNRRFAESPDEVARKTIDGIRKGEFLVTTTVIAYMIRTLARGFIPPDSFISFMIELLLLIPIKILSFFYLQYIKGVILRGESVKASKE